MRTSLRPGLWSLAALLAACSGEPTEKAAADKAAEKPVEAPAHPEAPPVTQQSLEGDHEQVALVPSPLETQKALDASGIQTKLSTLIPKHEFDMADAGQDHAAVRTGVILADLLLTTKTATDDELVGRLGKIQQGMTQLGAGPDIDATLKDYGERIKAKAVQRDDLLKEFDELSGAVIPELKFNGQERVVPLIEAGSWLEGANLVGKALKTATDKSAAEKLLKAPSVVDFFLKYVKTEGAGKTPEAVTTKLEASLGTLKSLAEKTEPLTDADLDTVVKVTDDVLGLLSIAAFLALHAPAFADEKDAETCLRTKVWDGYADGWGVRTMTSATIPDGKTRNYLVTLYSGNEYRIQTCADDHVKNLDVLLYDTHGNVLARDPAGLPNADDREPVVSFKPPTTGTYYIVLYVREAREINQDGAVAMAVVYR